MIARKEIIILNGGGHKGIIKISGVTGMTGVAKISCSLDFRPNGAKLYLIGDNVAQMTLNNTNCEDEVSFYAKSEIGCVLRSSSITMFGGSGSKSEMLKKIDAFLNDRGADDKASKGVEKSVKRDEERKEAEMDGDELTDNAEDYLADDNDMKKINAHKDEDEGGAEFFAESGYNDVTKVSAKADASPLGEWTKYDGNNFYYAVKPQIEEMFVCYPEEELLSAAVPNSKWVRVDAEDGYYVVGLLYDEDEPSFICYGVPQPKTDGTVKAPSELENMCVWLPVDVSDSVSGYWIIYQSAKTGEIIK